MKGDGCMANKSQHVAKTATESLQLLWESHFFQDWKNKKAVVDALAKRHNHFSDPELGMALMRAKHLTRRGKRGNYEYIQKYPFVTSNGEPAIGKRGNKK